MNVLSPENMSFTPVTREHQAIILSWLKEDHVKEFYYGDGLKNTLENLELYCKGIKRNGRYFFDLWIAHLEDKPFGFLMTSPLEPREGADKNSWYVEGDLTIALDILIGPKDFLGKGLSHVMIQHFILDKFSHVDTVIIDPEVSNPKAIHVYEKAGFEKLEEFIPSYNPIPHIMMKLIVLDLKIKLGYQNVE
jgi:RimJ/RimL family protein N-acetyltransferase